MVRDLETLIGKEAELVLWMKSRFLDPSVAVRTPDPGTDFPLVLLSPPCSQQRFHPGLTEQKRYLQRSMIPSRRFPQYLHLKSYLTPIRGDKHPTSPYTF